MRVDGLGDARRILVYGVTGSGKSTLAAQLSAINGLPWHSVDDLTWRPGWVEVPQEEQRRRIEAICAEPAWILDTAYGAWRDVPLRYAPVVVALDYSRWFSLQRLVRRTLVRWVRRTPVCNGNHEDLRSILSPRRSIISWHVRSFRSKRERIRAWAEDPEGPPVVVLRSPGETRRWLEGVEPVGPNR